MRPPRAQLVAYTRRAEGGTGRGVLTHQLPTLETLPVSSAALRYSRIVVKVGTSTLTAGGDAISPAALRQIGQQIGTLLQRGAIVALVTSGAAAAGRERLGVSVDAKDVPRKQVLAAVGQALLMRQWDQVFRELDVPVAQALLTRQDLSNRQSYLNARTTLLNCFDCRVLPIINENDVTAVDELRIGDNDQLSALVANLMDADLLVLLTDSDGLYTADPRRDSHARLIPIVEHFTPEIERVAVGAGTPGATGGMRTKLLAARSATRSGTSVIIASGTNPRALVDAATGAPIGTLFLAQAGVEGRRRWLATGVAGRGRITIDAGAVQALVSGGKSLLAAGVCSVSGHFVRGDPVLICTQEGTVIASGLSNYNAGDVGRIAGHHSHEIAPLLGYTYGPEVVHRNNLAVLQ